MTTEPTDTPPSGSWGDSAPVPATAPGKNAWSGRKTAIAAGVAVVIAAGGGLAIWAGTSSDATAQAQQGGPGGRGFGAPPGMGGNVGGAATILRDALHGDFVVSDGKGGYTTERLQTGDVTEVSATSISLTSKDGYKQVYAIGTATEKTTEPKTGASVTVLAKVSGTTATATSISTPGTTGTTGRGTGQGRNGGQVPPGGRQGAPPPAGP
ncbi:hypothetical protein [Amycolatopsis sp. H20-H5]|uniref:hypothetical protein n=1 Tax=Amycolatopsis sp. H20-H5 TaxID=3046309 RepID=UPI002DBD2F95|nr:hypothetical protein [Amycolatopsis sp. H20-H5]MEC3975153.1 hypothetical protein [Amycolatopsis sp. H20-H5]